MAFFAVGTLWWVIVTVVCAILLFVSTGAARLGWSTICFLAYLAILQWVSHVPVFNTIAEHPWKTLTLLALYAVIGVTWSFVRWWLQIQRWVQGKEILPALRYGTRYRTGMPLTEYRRIWYEDNLEKIKIPEKYDDSISDVKRQKLDKLWEEHVTEIQPKAISHKGKITTWILYWPFSMSLCLVEDLIREIIKWLVTKIRAGYDAISDAAMKNVHWDKKA